MKKKPSLHVMKKEEKKPEVSKETLESFKATSKTNTVLASFPPHLKDPANYEKIQRALLDALATTHSHGEMVEWANCVKCQRKMNDHAELMYQLGFKVPGQYMIWKKIHEQIKTRVKLR